MDSEEKVQLFNDLATSIYGMMILFGFGLVMLFVHLFLDFVFHN